MNQELKEIYSRIDARSKRYKEEYKLYAISKGYQYFSEYLHKEYGKEYKNRTGESIIREMINSGTQPVKLSTIWTIQNRVKELLQDNVPPQQKDKICYNCRTDKIQRKIAPGNFALCKVCDPKNRKIKVDRSFSEPFNCEYA